MRRILALTLCLILLSCVCFADVTVFPDSSILAADVYAVKDDSLIRKQFSLEIPRTEDPSVKLIENALSGCTFMRLSGIEYGNEIYTVLLSRTSSAAADQIALYCFAIAQTMIGNGICDGVNVLIDGICPICENTPINTVYGLFEGNLDLPSLLEQHKESRLSTVYLPDRSGKYIVAVPTSVPAGEFSYKSVLSLIGLVDFDNEALCPIPAGLADMVDLRTEYDASGRLLLTVNFQESALLDQILGDLDCDRWQFWASICFSIFTNCPGIERIRITAKNSPVTSFPTYSGSIIETKNGELSRLTYAGRLGIIRQGYEKNSDGIVSCKAFVLLCQSLNDPARIIESCVPGINAGDILEAYISGQDAYVCLSDRLYEVTTGYTLAQAHDIYFAVVNTLCSNLKLKRVKFLVGNMPAQTLPCGLTLEGFLYPDPGFGR